MGALIALIAIVAGASWAGYRVNGSGRSAAVDMLRRVLGDGATANLRAAYHEVADRMRETLIEVRPGARVAITPTPPPTAQDDMAAASRPASIVTVTATAEQAATATPIRIRAASTRRAPPSNKGATAPGRGAPTVPARPVIPPLPPALKHPPTASLLNNDYQVYETWNNCGPASLSMALSYFGIHESQAALGQILRPYENTTGDNDDKDVTFDELANEARTFGLLAYHRPDGNIRLLKRFVASGMPVIAETIMTKDDDIGHFRVVKGYDDRAQTITQDDSMQGHNVRFSYADFDYMWKRYNYEYLVLVPPAKERLARAILGKDMDTRTAWQETVRMDQAMLVADPADVAARFNLSVALYYVGQYRQSVREFEQIQYQLPARTLWYQIEPIESYYVLGEYQKVFALSDTILNNGDRAFSQLYILRGEIDRKQGNLQAARAEFESAVYYNTNLKAAQDALRSIQ